MSNQHTNLQARDQDGRQLQFTSTTTDSPILPVEALHRLAELDPKLVNWVVEQTQIEADFRRAEVRRTNTFIFSERLAGIFAGAIIALFGLGIAAYVAIRGHDYAAMTIGGATLATIVAVLVKRQSPDKPPTPAAKRKRRK